MIKVTDYIARFLYEKGLRHVFMVTGGGAMHLNDSFARVYPFSVVYNHHEQACAIAAEGLYRASGQMGIVNVTTGPGGLNTLTGLLGQATDSIPAIYVSGQVKFETTITSCPEVGLRQLGDQEVDIIKVVSPLVKYAVTVSNPQDIRQVLERALWTALNGRMGPVWIDVPMNVQGASIDESSLVAWVEPPKEEKDYKKQALLVADVLRRAARPVIVVGHGIRLARAQKELAEFISHLKVPLVTTFNGFDLVADEDPLFCGRIGTIGTRGGNFTLQNADAVLFLGTRNNIRQISYNWENFARRATTVAVDIDPAELQKPTFRPTHGVVADLKDFLPYLTRELAKADPLDFAQWLKWARERSDRYPVTQAGHWREPERIHPYAFFLSWTEGLSDDATVVAGNGTACVVLFQAGKIKSGQRMFWNSGCASMGYDLPAAIGAATGTNGPVWCVAGDGSLQMNLQELATLGFHRWPIKLVYLNNGGYASIRQTQVSFFGKQYGCGTVSGLGFPDMEVLAKAYGLPFVRTRSIDQVRADQLQVLRTEGPVIWEIELKMDYSFEPKLSSEKLPDGKIVSKPLEDMFPFLPREEFAQNMISESNEKEDL